MAAGEVSEDGLALADGSVGGTGDIVTARKNDRRLRLPGGGWVRNRDRFVVTVANQDGSMAVRPADGGGEVVLPAAYVAESVELGYATTVFCPGADRGDAHAVVGTAMTRETLYVAATRGRASNKLYVDLEPEPPDAEASRGQPERLSARQMLISVAHRRGAEASAHQVMASDWATAESLEQLVAEHESLVSVASSERWVKVLAGNGYPADVVAAARRSPEWDGLARALDQAQDRGLPVGVVLTELAGLLPAGTDPASALRTALGRWEKATNGPWPRPRELVAGLVPLARGIEDEDIAKAVREREELIAIGARQLAEEAVRSGKRWAEPFGSPPKDPVVAEAWWDRLAVIAAYRERWHVSSPGILGDEVGVGSVQQALHRGRARRAGQEAAVLSGIIAPRAAVPSAWPVHSVQVEPEIDL